MTRIFDDEQTTSLVRAMANPESNARKMAEQNQEIQLSLICWSNYKNWGVV